MQSVEIGSDNENSWPNHRCWPDDEPTTQSRERESGDLAGEGVEQVETNSEIVLVPEFGGDDGIQGVSRRDGCVGHDHDTGMFLDVERTRVESQFVTAQPRGEVPGSDGHNPSKRFADGIDDNLNHEGRDVWCRIPEVEEGVDAGTQNSEEDAEHKRS